MALKSHVKCLLFNVPLTFVFGESYPGGWLPKHSWRCIGDISPIQTPTIKVFDDETLIMTVIHEHFAMHWRKFRCKNRKLFFWVLRGWQRWNTYSAPGGVGAAHPPSDFSTGPKLCTADIEAKLTVPFSASMIRFNKLLESQCRFKKEVAFWLCQFNGLIVKKLLIFEDFRIYSSEVMCKRKWLMMQNWERYKIPNSCEDTNFWIIFLIKKTVNDNKIQNVTLFKKQNETRNE